MSSARDQEISQSTLQARSKSDSESQARPGSPHQQTQHNGFGGDSPQSLPDEFDPEVQDPLPGMSDIDRWGIKGLLGVLNGPYPDQAALYTGVDINSLGFDLNSTE